MRFLHTGVCDFLDPTKNLAAFVVKILVSCVPFLLVYWQVTVSLGLVGLAIHYILHHTWGMEKKM